MRSWVVASLGFLFSQTLLAMESIPIKDNGEIGLTLSQGNYNRLLIKNDKIVEAAFPPHLMSIKRDAQDGSVYMMPVATNPFTLFLTTEAGRHFSIAVTGAEGLGKTIELKVEEALPIKSTPAKKEIRDNALSQAIVALITHMERHERIDGVSVKRQFGRAERVSPELTLVPKELWVSPDLNGEIIDVYNGGKTPLTLTESWFAKAGVKAIKLSQNTVAPKSRVVLYRVKENRHG